MPDYPRLMSPNAILRLADATSKWVFIAANVAATVGLVIEHTFPGQFFQNDVLCLRSQE